MRPELEWNEIEDAKTEEIFMEAAFELLKYTGILTTAIAGVKPVDGKNRNSAILNGLVVKIAKSIKVMVRDLSNQEIFQHLSISRQILETCANLQYLTKDTDGSRFDKYVKNSLFAEKHQLLDIERNIAKRGKIWPIEKRMIKSIKETVEASGLSIEELKSLTRSEIAYPTAEQRLRELGDVYSSFRILSGEVHGTWTELLKYHLLYKKGVFTPNLEEPPLRPQIATSIVSIVALILPSYLSVNSEPHTNALFDPLLSDVISLQKRLVEAHEKYLAS